MSQKQPERLLFDQLETPIGIALLITDDQGHLRALDWEDYEDRLLRLLRLHYGASTTMSAGAAPAALRQSLDHYFAGDLKQIDAIVYRTAGTPFQRAVWTALRDIPAGTTMTYSALAAKLAMPKAVRAVGLANGANPVGVVVPCHRVIGANGSLTGYGGGLERKRWLLAHEGAIVSERRKAA